MDRRLRLLLRYASAPCEFGAATIPNRCDQPTAPFARTRLGLRAHAGESLTPLGEHLSRLPLDARVGKLLLVGASFGPAGTNLALTVTVAVH